MALAIVLTLAGVGRSWALAGLGDIKFDGSLETLGISGSNADDQNDVTADSQGEVNTRLRLGMDFGVTEGVTGRIELGRTDNSQYGKNSDGATTTADASNSIDNETGNIFFNNAYLQLDDLLGLGVKLGRQYVGNANDLVWFIGVRSNDNLDIHAIDGLGLSLDKFEVAKASLFLGKAQENDGEGANDNTDVNINSLDVTLPTLLPGGKINLGYLWGVAAAGTPSSTAARRLQTMRIGVNGGLKEDMLTYRAEYLANGGRSYVTDAGLADPDGETKYKGSAIDLGVGYNAPESKIGKLGVRANYVAASGDDTNDDEDKSFHDFTALGVDSSDRYFGEIFGKSDAFNAGNAFGGAGVETGLEGAGLQVLNIGATLKPTILDGKTSVALDYYMLNTAEDNAAGDNDLGSELDLILGYDHSANVGVQLGAAMLSPGDRLNAVNDDPIRKLFAKLNVKWGGEDK